MISMSKDLPQTRVQAYARLQSKLFRFYLISLVPVFMGVAMLMEILYEPLPDVAAYICIGIGVLQCITFKFFGIPWIERKIDEKFPE